MLRFLFVFFVSAFCLQSIPSHARQENELDKYLQSKGFNLNPLHSKNNEGYMTDPQKVLFIKSLNRYSNIHTVAEIGLNGGHSAELFFNKFKALTLFVSFDLNQHPYTKFAVEYFTEKYKSKFFFVEGDSKISVLQYAHDYPMNKFDFIFIDGCHSFEGALADIVNMKQLAHANTIVWIDDIDKSFSGDPARAFKECEKNGMIKLIQHFDANHPTQGYRCWVEARYLFQ